MSDDTEYFIIEDDDKIVLSDVVRDKLYRKSVDGGYVLKEQRKEFLPTIKSVGSRKVKFVISTGSVDRDGDKINPRGVNLTNFKNNPVVLFGHDSTRPPIGRASKIKVEGDKLTAVVEFASDNEDPSGFSDTIYRMVEKGYLRAASIGFLPKKFEPANTEDRRFGVDYSEVELLEFSIVAIPSNPEALVA